MNISDLIAACEDSLASEILPGALFIKIKRNYIPKTDYIRLFAKHGGPKGYVIDFLENGWLLVEFKAEEVLAYIQEKLQ